MKFSENHLKALICYIVAFTLLLRMGLMGPPKVHEWFNSTFGRNPGKRAVTWRTSLGIFLQKGGSTIVETGCQRFPEDWGAGCSTRILSSFLKQFRCGRLHSVDNSQANINTARSVVTQDGSYDYVDFHLADSVQFLLLFNGSIDFLYLDSFDYRPEDPTLSLCQSHQLAELKSAFDKLSVCAVVLLDDNNLPHGGKTKLAKDFLLNEGWRCLIDFQQSLWVRQN